jgi:diguanylate cyclase (GGDEF)-like protein
MGSHQFVKRFHAASAGSSDAETSLQVQGPEVLLSRIRSQFLEALPVAGAVVGIDKAGAPELIDCNLSFAGLDSGRDLGRLLARTGLGDRLVEFLRGEPMLETFDWVDGDPIVGRHYAVRISRLFAIEELGPRCLLTLLDRTAERATEKSLRLEMFNDSLTGLLNRAGFSDHLENALDGAEPGRFAVLVIDLLRFSRINESIGAVSGDELLITVARRLLSALRAGDVIARTGGDEFGMLVRIDKGNEDALAIADRVNAVLVTPCRLSELEIRVGCAIGCAVLEADCDGDELIRRAQFAVKRAKATGRTEIYRPRDFNQARHQFSIETALRRAIEADRLRLSFQPVIDLSSGALKGFEALARWREDDVDMSPASFIPVAEESGLIVPLGRWALDAALKTLAEWDARSGGPLDTCVAVNVSAIQIARDDIAQAVGEALSRHRLAGHRLTLELTESSIVKDPDRATRAMHELKALDAQLALDDFGTGYSNLAYLQRLPIDVLKIDQSFVSSMLASRDNLAIVRAVLSLAQALKLKTTAEGVETVELSRTLSALGCSFAQGFYYAPPLDPDAAFDFICSWSSSAAI